MASPSVANVNATVTPKTKGTFVWKLPAIQAPNYTQFLADGKKVHDDAKDHQGRAEPERELERIQWIDGMHDGDFSQCCVSRFNPQPKNFSVNKNLAKKPKAARAKSSKSFQLRF